MKNLFKALLSWFKKKERLLYLEYGVLTSTIMLPLLKPGYLLLLDFVITPKIPKPLEIQSDYPLAIMMHYLGLVIPSQGLEKILFFLVFFLSGLGMHKLIPTKNKWPKYFGAILYIFNPFVYSRFLFGHIHLLLAYAITPFFIISLFTFFKNTTLKNALRLTAFFLLIIISSIHAIFFAAILFAITGIVYLFIKWNDKDRLIKTACSSIGVCTLVALFSLYWLIPYAKGETTSSKTAQGFDSRHVVGFQTTADEQLGVLVNTASMYGFWGDKEGRYLVQKDIVPGWVFLFVIIFSLSVWGTINNLKKEKLAVWVFVISGLLAFILAVGVAHPAFGKIYWTMYKYVPLFKGFREPQKFVALLVLSYAYLGALGVNAVLEKTNTLKGVARKIGSFAPAILLLIPLLYSPAMLWGFGGQVKPVDYPKDWYATNEELNADTEDFEVLFLPWHQYMGFLFAGRVIANPAQRFFDKPIIQGDNAEFGTIYTQNDNPTSDFIEKNILKNKSENNAIGQNLNAINVKYIILAKEVDWKNYAFLDNQEDLRLIKDTGSLKIYKNLIYKNENKD